LVFLLLFCFISVSAQEGSLWVVILELDYFLESLSFNEHSQGPTVSDFHDVGFEVVVSESEVKKGLRIFLNAGYESLLKEVIADVLKGCMFVGRHGLVKAFIVVEIIFFVFLTKADGHLLAGLHLDLRFGLCL
jgi:hypothetical protein